jgi:hypothetical protein
MNDWVYTVEWSPQAKEFRVVKVPLSGFKRALHHSGIRLTLREGN